MRQRESTPSLGGHLSADDPLGRLWKFHGDASQNWLILKNGDHVIGLFQGMFERNILTFNPGWDNNAQPLASFTDIRELQRELMAQGVEFQQTADETTTGPASFIASDPDGNPILVDQHV